ncbi:MAG: hypothetical protein ACE5R5_02155 [Nitrosarchaeum sp.]
MSIQEIIQNGNQSEVKINDVLDYLDEKTIEDIHQAIEKYRENRCNSQTIDYMW